jgi:hypothetical protein
MQYRDSGRKADPKLLHGDSSATSRNEMAEFVNHDQRND